MGYQRNYLAFGYYKKKLKVVKDKAQDVSSLRLYLHFPDSVS